MTYVELHAKSFFSFGLGASHAQELLAQAAEFEMPALALTDTNLCGALEFARLAHNLDIQPISGGELTLCGGARLTLLAKTRGGYANLSRLFTLANAVNRREPELDPEYLADHAEGLVLLSGGRNGPLSGLVLNGCQAEARNLLNRYRDWFGADSVYVELQHNFLCGDGERNYALIELAREVGAPLVATNDVHYHSPERYRLQHALVAAKRNTTLDQALQHIQPNHHFRLKSQAQMAELFADWPAALRNSQRIAEQCEFNLKNDLGYTLPKPPVPAGYTPETYLRRLCEEAAARRYGSVTSQVKQRLDEEFRLIERHKLAGFLLLYREIVDLAQQIMEERGLIEPETPIEARPPGRGRGSSVALLVGYLIGISHIDPLQWDLSLERFLPDDMTSLPDIDLDFPRGLREELIERVHDHFGRDYAVLSGAISTYSTKGIIQDLGKALGLPPDDLRLLSDQLHSRDSGGLREQMEQLPGFKNKVTAYGWRDLVELAPQLMGAPRGLSQHVGGIILSSSPIPEMVPVRAGAIAGRYIMDWDKDSVADANFAKIDLLSLPVLDQIEEALDLIERREGERPDLSRISPEDEGVYDLINAGQAKGVFLLQSPAQLKMGQRLKSRNLRDLAYQVALIRPGVGTQGSAVSQFVERYRQGVAWEYDHPLEQRALERGYGIIVWQEQVVQLIMDVAGMTGAEADEVRRAFAKQNNGHLIAMHRKRFIEGAQANGVPLETAERIFGKINGHYMFPESHSHAFAITAYQVAWLKRYYPLEFFVSLINNQPMGFYPVETLKEDARRFATPLCNPCVNRSQVHCVPENGAARLGLGMIKDIGPESGALIVKERERHGPYVDVGEFVRRTGLKTQSLRSLVEAGAFDALTPNRREALWESGLSIRPAMSGQRAFAVAGPAANAASPPRFDDFSDFEKMAAEYRVLGIYPRGHVMEFIRPKLDVNVLTAAELYDAADGQQIRVAGWPIARQHPQGADGMVFVTIEDETGDVQAIVSPKVFARCRRALSSSLIIISGRINRWDGTTNITAERIDAIGGDIPLPASHDWH